MRRRRRRHAALVDEPGVTPPPSSPSTPSPNCPLLENQKAKQQAKKPPGQSHLYRSLTRPEKYKEAQERKAQAKEEA